MYEGVKRTPIKTLIPKSPKIWLFGINLNSGNFVGGSNKNERIGGKMLLNSSKLCVDAEKKQHK